MPLNTSKKFKAGHRTLSWAVPYTAAKKTTFKLGDSHNNLALPLDWTSSKHRKMVTFLFVPPKTKMTFKIGYALPQTGNRKMQDVRKGFGLQMRLQTLPKNTIAVAVPIVFNEKQARNKSKDFKNIRLDLSARNALEVLASDPKGQNVTKAIKTHMDDDYTHNIFGWVKSAFYKVSGTDISNQSRINLKAIDDTGYEFTTDSDQENSASDEEETTGDSSDKD